jgi:hypothetical protein
MAHGMMTKSVTVHQALHGYAEGHRQFALSRTLSSRDQKTLLALSDISGVGVRLHPDGYLTGYPLPDSGVYALARTWPAPEMPRPGCVWTQTLLIDFADLAVCESLLDLIDAFHRPPIGGDFALYRRPREVSLSSRAPRDYWSDAAAYRLVTAIYGFPRARVVLSQPWPGVEELLLALWSQQWPRLRRGFRFCTFSASDRSTDAAPFDIQLLPSLDKHTRSRFQGAVDVESIAPVDEPWVVDAVEDLRAPQSHGLRAFFRRLGSDVMLGREAFKPLSQLHVTMQTLTTSPGSIQNALRLVQSELGEEAKTAKLMIARAALDRADQLDDQTFEFLLSAAASLDESDLKRSGRTLGIATWKRDPSTFGEMKVDPRLAQFVVEPALESIPIRDLLTGLERAPGLLAAALSIRPDLMSERQFWQLPSSADAAFDAVRESAQTDAVLEAMINSGRGDLARRALQDFGFDVLFPVVEKKCVFGDESATSWLRVLAADAQALSSYLASGHQVHKSVLYELAKQLGPDSLWTYEGDPWLQAWRIARGELNQDAETYISAFFLSRALGYRAKNPDELLRLGFEPTYHALVSGELMESAWRLLDDRLPLPVFWFQDDRSDRLISGAVNLFLRRELSYEAFGHLVQNGKLFFSLAENMANSGRGRRYLRGVRDALANDQGQGMHARAKFIDGLLK